MNIHEFLKFANGDKVKGKKPSKEDVAAFLKKHPNPHDSAFHEWAEDNGYDIHAAEAMAYQIASEAVKTAGLSKGETVESIARKHKVPVTSIEKQIQMGMKAEQEHTDNPKEARRIALDHLTEMADYYTKLKKMEGEH